MRNKLRKLLPCVLAVLVVLMSFPSFASDEPFEGGGTEDNPYLISTADDLVTLSELTNAKADETEFEDKHYKITRDINMSGVDFKGIARKYVVHETNNFTGTYTAFSGTIDGDGHTISNIIVDSSDRVGSNAMAGFVIHSNGATIKNLGIMNATYSVPETGSNRYVGGFVANGKVTLQNCFIREMTYASANKTNTKAFIANAGADSLIENCYSTVKNLAPVADLNSVKITATNIYCLNGIGTGNKGSVFTNHKNMTDATDDDKAEFILASNGAFVADTENINDGLPILKWEADAQGNEESPETGGEEPPDDDGDDEPETPGVNDIFESGIGDGSEEYPYELSTAGDLVKLSELTNAKADETEFEDKHYKITQDINMSGVDFKGIARKYVVHETNNFTGTYTAFSGTIDGDGHTISNLTVDSSDRIGSNAMAAFVIHSDGATIKNLGIINAVYKVPESGSNRYVGGFVANGKTTLQNCFIRAMSHSGGSGYTSRAFIANAGADSLIENCYSTVKDLAPVADLTKVKITATNIYCLNGIGTGNKGSVFTNHKDMTDASDDDKAAFIAASNGAFKQDINGINGGYPLLSWEDDSAGSEVPPTGGGEEPPIGGDDELQEPGVNNVFELGIGNGSKASPFRLSTAGDLVKLSELTNAPASETEFEDKFYELACDIDMSGVTDFHGIARRQMRNEEGTNDYTSTYAGFSGTIDGCGYIISNLSVDSSERVGTNAHAGFVIWSSGATIKNLGLNKVSYKVPVTGSDRYVGGIVATGTARIENCYVKEMTYEGGVKDKRTIIANPGNNTVMTNCYSTTRGIGIINAASASVTAINIYAANGIGTGKTGNVFTNTMNISDAGYDKDMFIAASDGAFLYDTNNINSGYPVLKWENERVSVNGRILISEFNPSTTGSCAFVIKNSALNSLTVAAAVVFYGANNEMLGAKIYGEISLDSGEVLKENVSLAGITSCKSARMFLWDSLNKRNITVTDFVEFMSE